MAENRNDPERRFVRRAVLVSLIAAVLLVTGVCVYRQLQPALAYQSVITAAQEGRYDDAAQALAGFKQNVEPVEYYNVVLSVAAAAEHRGDYEAGLALLDAQTAIAEAEETYPSFLEHAASLRMEMIYGQAQALYDGGDFVGAARLAVSIPGYAPAQTLYRQIEEATSTPVPSPLPITTPTPSSSPTATPTHYAESTNQVTSSPNPTSQTTPSPEPFAPLPDGHVTAGYAHTVFLRADGTVLAVGDNTYGQTDVEGWTNVTAVAAGAYHTLGLTADGHVLATGDNTHGQTDITMFSDVKQIAAGDWDSIVLLTNGQIYSVGFHEYDFLNNAEKAEKIFAGSYGVMVATPNGLVASHAGLSLDADCVSVALSRGYALGVDAAGMTHATMEALDSWKNVAHVAAGENATLALTMDGQVLCHFFDGSNQNGFSFEKPVAALAAGPNHYAFVFSDGTAEIRRSDGTAEVISEQLW